MTQTNIIVTELVVRADRTEVDRAQGTNSHTRKAVREELAPSYGPVTILDILRTDARTVTLRVRIDEASPKEA